MGTAMSWILSKTTSTPTRPLSPPPPTHFVTLVVARYLYDDPKLVEMPVRVTSYATKSGFFQNEFHLDLNETKHVNKHYIVCEPYHSDVTYYIKFVVCREQHGRHEYHDKRILVNATNDDVNYIQSI